jgi:cytochrome c peroxidase
MGDHYSTSSQQVLNYWKEMMGPTLSPFAHAETYAGGVLTVKVRNTTLYALLSRQEKPKLLKRLREAFPKLMIKTIEFRIG